MSGPGRTGGQALQTIPLRGSVNDVSSDPTIYRFHEMVQVHGTPLKALVLEQFGGGITSTINIKLDIKKSKIQKEDRAL